MQFQGLAESLVLRTPSYFCRDANLADIARSSFVDDTKLMLQWKCGENFDLWSEHGH
jgi:hypothetical protein